MPTGDNQTEAGEFHSLLSTQGGTQPISVEMRLEVINPTDRQILSQGYCLGHVNTHQEGPGQSGAKRHCNATDVPPGESIDGLTDNGDDGEEMLSRRNFRYHTSIASMNVYLRSDNI